MVTKLAANSVKLNWQTTQEVNASHFEVEKSSDGSKFANLTTVAAKGNAGNGASYVVNDDKPLQGKNFYRIKMVDKNGAFAYTDTRVIDISNNMFAVSPNPAKGAVNVYGVNGKYVQVVNAAGKVVLSRNLKSGNNTISTARLASGVYIVKIVNSNNTEETHKLVIEQ